MEIPKIETENFRVPSGVISASLLSGKKSATDIAVVIPGADYSCTMPLLYYSIDLLLLKGFQVLTIDKIYSEDPIWRGFKSSESALEYVERDTVELFAQISSKYSTRVKVLLGRSLGSYQMAFAIEKQLIHPERIVWQSPSLREKWSIIQNCGIPGFGIIGTADERYESAKPHLPKDCLIVDGADHGMEIPGRPIESIEVLKKVIQATDNWISPARQ